MSRPGQITPLSDEDTYVCYNPDCVDDATYSYCTESDSMGDEYEYYCDEHIEEISQSQRDTMGNCEWCHVEDVALHAVRDMEEGSQGPVYWVCSNCKKQQIISDRDEEIEDDLDDDFDD